MIVTAPDLPDSLEKSLHAGISEVSTLVDPAAYLAAARAQHLEASSDAALSRLAPKSHAYLVVFAEESHGKLKLAYYDGATGALLERETLPAPGKHPQLSRHALHTLSVSVRNALARSSKRLAADTPQETGWDASPGRPEAAKPQPVAIAAVQPSAAAPSEPAAAPSEPDQAQSKPEAPASDGESSADSLVLFGSIGGGGGMRTLDFSSNVGQRGLDSGFALPALEIGIGAEAMLGSQWLLRGEAQYRTFFGMQATQTLPNGVAPRTSLSTHTIIVGVAPGYRFGPSGSVELWLFVGGMYRSLSAGDATAPTSSLYGPMLRPELWIPIADSLFVLRLAPEVVLLTGVDASLLGKVSGLSALGIAYGGEISFDMRLARAVNLGVMARESRASVSSIWGPALFDLERVAILRVTLHN